MMIQWNGEKKSVEYVSSTFTRSIIASATRVFNITIPIEQLCLLNQDQKEIDRDSTIPFSGYPEGCCFLYPKPNITANSSDESDTKGGELFIEHYGDYRRGYPFEKKKRIHDYFIKYLTDLDMLEDCEDCTCVATETKHKYDHNSTLADLKIKPNDTVYVYEKSDAVDCIWIHNKTTDKQLHYDYDEKWSVKDYISKALTVSAII